ncbi:MAG: hypothetical protein J6K12_03630 [Clostridia bacterium]|nr:hypothetical protein [Clostridia bacterium]
MTDRRQKNIDDFTAGGCHITACAQCGYQLINGDSALRVHETGDIIHKDCWMDYFDENMGEFAIEVEF